MFPFDPNDTYLDIGIKGAKADGSAPKTSSRNVSPTHENSR